MKKIIAVIILSFLFITPGFGVDFLPKYNNSINNYGIGLYFGNGDATLYKEADDKSPVVAKLSWDTQSVSVNGIKTEPKNVFGVFLPDNALSGFIVLDEEGSNYTKVIYDNKKGLSGWIKNAPNTKVFYWRQLFYKYGKSKGLYIFANIPKDERNLRLSPEDFADISYSFIYPKYIKIQLINGNWALIKLVDYDNEQKVGWFRWRNSDGSLNMYPLFNGI